MWATWDASITTASTDAKSNASTMSPNVKYAKSGWTARYIGPVLFASADATIRTCFLLLKMIWLRAKGHLDYF